jgi:hypothetical protein
MRQTRFLYSFFLLIAVFSSSVTTAQPVISADKSVNLVEKTGLCTDRSVYCVDEQILFSAYNLSALELRDANWSNVLYVELIAPDGQVVTRKKCAYGNDGATGTLVVPAGTLTGNYYLRAYTRWMRDFSPYNYFYKLITVINPYRPELLEPTAEIISNPVKAPVMNNLDLEVIPDQVNYKKREQANLTVKFNKPYSPGDKYTISVVPVAAGNLQTPDLSGLQELRFKQNYIPETRGLSISGTVVNQADSVPIPYTLVGLTVFKQNPEILNIRTNDKGQFYFDLSKQKGEFEIFISAKAVDNKIPMILVDNDFSTDRIDLPFIPLDLSTEAINLYQSLSFTSQIQKLYRQQKIGNELKALPKDLPFYGSPDFAIKLSDYVALPSIREYFYELVPSVRIKNEAERSTMKVLGAYSDLAVFDPLVLVDMVPVFDVDRVLALQPDKIDRIEVVTIPYVRGDIVFGGIVSLFSKKGDLAGIDLPTAGRFITYNMLGNETTREASASTGQRIPDLRNCLYWNPSVKSDQSGKINFSFNVGDNSGEFQVIINCLSETGRLLNSKARIFIK